MALQHEIGASIRRLRIERGLTQEALAGKAQVDRPHLSEIETGQMDPRISTLVRIAGVLGVEVRDLMPSTAHGASPGTADSVR